MFERIIPTLISAEKIAIFTHSHPDGDAMGSSYGLKLILKELGKTAEVFLQEDPDVPAESLMIKGKDTGLKPENCDLFVAMDSADSKRLGSYERVFLEHGNTLAIDHHETHVKYAGDGVVTSLSSTCELVVDLAKELGVTLTKEIANNLYIGLVTDTGNFKYSCVTGDTMRAGAELIDTGIDFSELAKVLFDTKSKEYYSLMKTALDKLQYFCGGKVAVLYLSPEDYMRSGLREAESVGIVNIPNSIGGVEVGVFIRAREDGEFKVSLRSNRYINVARIAVELGGGGHERASGYSVSGKTIDETVSQAVTIIEKALDAV